MAIQATLLDQRVDSVGIGNSTGITTALTGVVLGSLLQPLADSRDLLRRKRVHTVGGHDLVGVGIVYRFPQVFTDDIAGYYGVEAGEVYLVIVIRGCIMAPAHGATLNKDRQHFLSEIGGVGVTSIHGLRFLSRSVGTSRTLLDQQGLMPACC